MQGKRKLFPLGVLSGVALMIGVLSFIDQFALVIPVLPEANGDSMVVPLFEPLDSVGMPGDGFSVLLTPLVVSSHSFASVFVPHVEGSMIETVFLDSLPAWPAIREKGGPETFRFPILEITFVGKLAFLGDAHRFPYAGDGLFLGELQAIRRLANLLLVRLDRDAGIRILLLFDNFPGLVFQIRVATGGEQVQ